MNIRLIVFSSLLILGSHDIVASEAGPSSTTTTSLEDCCICGDPMTQKQWSRGLLADGQEIYGCLGRHLFHYECIFNADGTPKTARCPICRATKDSVAVAAEEAALKAHYRDHYTSAPVATPIPAPLPPLHMAQHNLVTAPTPARVQPATWHHVVNQLSRSNKLDLHGRNLTSAELAAIIEALPPIIREFLTTLDIYDNHLTTLPDTIELLTALQEIDITYNQLTRLPYAMLHLSHLRNVYIDSPVALPPFSHEVTVYRM